MESILKRLYDGELYPDEQFLPDSQEYKRLLTLFSLSEKEFTSRLQAINPALVEQYEEMWNKYLDVLALRREEMFQRSFCLGAALVAEALVQT